MRFLVRSIPAGASAVEEAIFDAENVRALREDLRTQGCIVLSARAVRTPILAVGTRFDAAAWCRELRTLLRSGMTVVEAVETLAESHDDAERVRIQTQMLEALQRGKRLSGAMAATGVFPPVLLAGVIASERTSSLAAALDDFLDYDAMIERLRRHAVSAAIYPAVVTGLGCAIAVFLLLFVIPRFSRMYGERQASLTWATDWVLATSRVVQAYQGWIAVGLGMAAVALWAGWRHGLLTKWLLRAVERVALLRVQVNHFRLAKLYQSLALMLRGGYTLSEALDVCRSLDLGPGLEQQVKNAYEQIAGGSSASSAFVSAGLADTVAKRLLAVGERGGTFDIVVLSISQRHAVRFTDFVERATRIVEPVLLLLVAVVVGGIVVLMYMPIFDMANGLGGTP